MLQFLQIQNKRHSFALTEVLIAFSLFLIVSPLLFNFIGSTAKTYQHLNHSLLAHNMAEEHLSSYVASFILQPPPFASLEEKESINESHGSFTVEKSRSRIEGDERVALLQFEVTVAQNDKELRSQSVKLCVTK